MKTRINALSILAICFIAGCDSSSSKPTVSKDLELTSSNSTPKLQKLTVAAPKTFPVYIVEMSVDALDVEAPSTAEADKVASLWCRASNTASMEFPYAFATRDEAIAAYPDIDPSPAFYPYPESSQPFVRLSDRHRVRTVVYATTTVPKHDARWKAISYADWLTATNQFPDAEKDIRRIQVTLPDLSVYRVNTDSPTYDAKTYKIYRRYFINICPHIWYYQTSSSAAALAQANTEWVTGGFYALGRRNINQYTGNVGNQSLYSDAPLNALRWKAYDASICEPQTGADRLGSSFEYVSDSLPTQTAPYLVDGYVP